MQMAVHKSAMVLISLVWHYPETSSCQHSDDIRSEAPEILFGLYLTGFVPCYFFPSLVSKMWGMLSNEKSIECRLTLLSLCHACKMTRHTADSKAAKMFPWLIAAWKMLMLFQSIAWLIFPDEREFWVVHQQLGINFTGDVWGRHPAFSLLHTA